MTQILSQQWFDSNSDRSFPLVDGVSRLSAEGFVLPNDLIVDMRLAAPVSLDATKFYISKTAAFGSGLVLTIAVDTVGDVASVTVPLAGFVEFSTFTVAPLPGYDVGGTVVIGRAATAIAAGSGLYTFVLATTQILPTCIFPAAVAVSSITVVDAFGGETKLTGAVVLVAGENASISAAGQTVTFGMDSGVVLEDPCDNDTGGTKRKPVRSISGVVPDSAGNIELVGTDCLVVSPGTGLVKLSDSCAQPCCGSPELDALATSVKLINTELARLAGNDAALENALRTLLAYAGQ